MKFTKAFMESAVAAVLGVPLIAIPAVADEVPRSAKVAASCMGKPRETVFRQHDNRPVMVPLRCGAKRWGYKHLSDTHGPPTG
ncbi:hypothetical protein [Streptomyces spectabilis]|uniref:Uncharacterized protein n=1 Tax=Streptomyces spectabilis TaxID=68270 RepID=A0A516RJX5_STRST|nr:hypothetical protein [Streptomyces spectabilis]QDQ15949.1 hypothetical protein FH965_39855 [Streptomyces spectabilis]